MNQLDLLSIRTFYRQWIHSKASERSGVVISIGPDPILNRLEGPSGKEFYRAGIGIPVKTCKCTVYIFFPLKWKM